MFFTLQCISVYARTNGQPMYLWHLGANGVYLLGLACRRQLRHHHLPLNAIASTSEASTCLCTNTCIISVTSHSYILIMPSHDSGSWLAGKELHARLPWGPSS